MSTTGQKTTRVELEADVLAHLSVLRRAQQWHVFESIAAITFSWLSQHTFSASSLVDQLDIKPEQLAPLLGIEPKKSKVQTRTWKKLVMALLMRNEHLAGLRAQKHEKKYDASDVLHWIQQTADALPEVVSDEYEDVLQKLDLLSPASRTSRAYTPEVLSETAFSEGLQESLQRMNSELQYLTVRQLEALEANLSSRRLWVQGPAGSGKTLFGVEAAYRALRAGLNVLIVFRSTQFRYVFSQLLGEVSENLWLLPHIDFMQLVRMIELYGSDSDAFQETLISNFPDLVNPLSPVWDLVIVDDCGTFESHMPWRLLDIDKLSNRTIMLAAPDQIMSHIVFDYGSELPEEDLDESLGTLSQAAGVLDQELVAPDHYDVVHLGENIRNARSIVSYVEDVTQVRGNPGIREQGEQIVHPTTWDKLHDDLLAVTSNGLLAYPPTRIRVIIDPHIWHPHSNFSLCCRLSGRSTTAN